jgi:hypothetical protein
MVKVNYCTSKAERRKDGAGQTMNWMARSEEGIIMIDDGGWRMAAATAS